MVLGGVVVTGATAGPSVTVGEAFGEVLHDAAPIPSSRSNSEAHLVEQERLIGTHCSNPLCGVYTPGSIEAMTMTASGPSLREFVLDLTGCDPAVESEFAWSDTERCDDCGVSDSTCVLSIDGESFERLCYHCAVER